MDIEKNLEVWGHQYEWPESGEEWSESWGGSEAQWYGCLLPRLRRFLPASRIVEIAPGHGRWTHFLLEHCDSYIGVDIAQSCIEACTKRFAGAAADFRVTDGTTLTGVADRSIDLGFSFDSLVHAEEPVLRGYLEEFARTLSDEGVAFIHHSNMGAHLQRRTRVLKQRAFAAKVPGPGRIVQYALPKFARTWQEHGRATSVTAEAFASWAAEAGLVCVAQETLNWGQELTIDCISVVVRPDSTWARPNVIVRNTSFMEEAASTNRVATAYLSLVNRRGTSG